MKTFITILTLVFGVSASAIECEQWAMQVFGYVSAEKSAIKNGKKSCSFQIAVDMTRSLPSAACPLGAEEIEASWFEDVSCEKEVGIDFSGVVVMQEGKFWIE